MTTLKNKRASFSSSSGAVLAVPYSLTQGETKNFDLTSSSQDATTITIDDPAYLKNQLKSAEWLQRYGLKAQKLTFDQILQQIGYKRLESYVPSIGKTVGAKYTGNQYHEIQHDNGDHYILTCRPEKLREFKTHVQRLLLLLRKRLAFITNGSRRVFGILGEPSICFVCDCKTTDHRKFNQFQSTLASLLREQVSKIKRFNIIWVSNDKEQFKEQPIDVTQTTIDQAIDWISERKCPRNKISISATCEAMLKAFTSSAHSIYLISEGDSSDSAREILRDNIVKTRLSSNVPIPVHVVSLFCNNSDTEAFLRSLAQSADGSFTSYKIHGEKTDLKPSSNLTDPTGIRFQDNTIKFGTNAAMSKPEQSTDLTLMYKEINQCHNIIERLDKILAFVQNENTASKTDTTKSLDIYNASNNKTNSNINNNPQRSIVIPSAALFNQDETEMSSVDWLKIYGIDAQKLDVISVLQPVAFRHCDGVVTVLKQPEDGNGKFDKTPANPKQTLVNAKYCDQFAHMAWSDGTIRHVFVTTDMHRDYERRIRALLEKIKARLSWLKKGSRDLFGTIVEKNIYILIDSSISMRNHLDFVKEKLRLLIQDQLFSKERINVVAFNTITNPWCERLVKVTDSKVTSQLPQWIDELYAEGSTNTLAALRFALADPVTEAIYLLTDGRPDQSERHILSQVQYRQKVPIHTIAFNCQDHVANQFLIDLSKQTGGRFHAFNYGLDNEGTPEIPESEDVTHLKQELARGEKDLQRTSGLRDECSGRAWSLNSIEAKYKNARINELAASLPNRSHSALDTTSRPNNHSNMSQRLERRKCSSVLSSRKQRTKSAKVITTQTNRIYINSNQWLLPETEEYLRRNDRQETHTTIIEYEEEQQVTPISLTKKIPTPFDEVKSYLKKNSLVTKGLTIFDVLYPTTITIKEPTHIQIIDRYVLSKVWDDILPLAYGSYASKLRLVNHYAVNLEKYEMDLKELISEYYQFIARFIWKNLNDEDKKQVMPTIYWMSISQEGQDSLAREITKDEYINQNSLEIFAWKKLSIDEQNTLLQKTPVYNETTQIVLKNVLKNAKAELVLKGVSHMDVEIKRAVKFLQISTDLRHHQKLAVNESKSTVTHTTIIKRKKSINININQRVLARYGPDGYFYIGTLQKSENGQLIVFFDMDVEGEAVIYIRLPTSLSSNQSNLFLNDCVLVRQMRETEEYWAPGLVMGLPVSFTLPSPLYMVQVYDPFSKQIYVHRKDMIRITVPLFQNSTRYLQNLYQNSGRNDIFINFQGPNQLPSTPAPGLSEADIKSILDKILKSLIEKIEHRNKVHHKRYHELKITIEDHTRVIRIIQEQLSKPPVRPYPPYPADVPTSPITPPSSRSTTGTDTSSEGTPTSRTPTPPSTPRLKPGTKVYAVWSNDDGLVYKSTIVEPKKSDYYVIERTDLRGILSIIPRSDIFLKSNHCRLKDVDIKSFALIQYPDDCRNCFCPAVILHHDKATTKVRFYDCIPDKDIDNHQDIIPIKKEQFEQYVASRIEKEKSLENQPTVGLNPCTNTFMLGTIKKRVGNGHEYLIDWWNGCKNEQKDEFLFPGVFTQPDNHQVNNIVLAFDENDSLYKPAKIHSISNDRKTLQVKFIHLSSRQANVPATAAFVISEAYYHKIIEQKHTQH